MYAFSKKIGVCTDLYASASSFCSVSVGPPCPISTPTVCSMGSVVVTFAWAFSTRFYVRKCMLLLAWRCAQILSANFSYSLAECQPVAICTLAASKVTHSWVLPRMHRIHQNFLWPPNDVVLLFNTSSAVNRRVDGSGTGVLF